jgi:phosphoesterase RecJ-like protein
VGAPREGVAQAAAALRGARTAIVATHIDPDGDAVASLLGMRTLLVMLGCDVHALMPGAVPPRYRFLPGADTVVEAAPAGSAPDLIVTLDTPLPERCNMPLELWDHGIPVLNCDHHDTNVYFGDVVLLDPKACSTAALIYRLFDHLGCQPSQEAATQLYCGVLTDTGQFGFPNADPEAFRIAARLAECGARTAWLADQVYHRRSVDDIALLSRALDSLEVTSGGRLATMQLDRDHLSLAQRSLWGTENLVDFAMSIEGVEVGLFFRGTDDGTVRVSLRAKDGFDVAEFASVFGGGGHKLAAGCRLKGDLDQTVFRVREEAQRWLTR